MKFFDATKGSGFIECEDGPDIFVHATAISEAGMQGLTAGDRVEFDVQPTLRGGKAVNLKAE